MKSFALLFLVNGLIALNEPITSDPFYGQKVGDIETYLRRLNSTPVPKNLYYTSHVRTTAGTLEDAKYYATHCRTILLQRRRFCVDWDCKHCRTLGSSSTLHDVVADEEYDIRATISIDNGHKSIVLSFRGSVSTKNWVENFRFDKTRFAVGQVHLGFKNQADALQPYYETIIGELLDQYPDYSLVLTGHSSGGSVALIAAIYLQKELGVAWKRIHLFTYGQPRVGNAKFASWVNTLELKMTRVVNENDLVPHMPPNFVGYYHQHTELYINQGKPTFCRVTSPEDSQCSNSRVPTVNIKNHMSAFGVGLGSDYC
ncbi:hypothetical protein DSO57_1025659 [Entomophthora muscae]|uniref:Uncharacterized protein n=1 Tax=Entomophthora muscae TaxID=34485 RepID=A0ACC2TPS6_9FUNG|nr:hypothetical protein DSO57_1025659 [Entomophthora muscae]